MTTFADLIAISAFWLFTGIWCGGKIEAHRWRSNALVTHRIESGGQLYKVTRQ